jgi:hypothetical protein
LIIFADEWGMKRREEEEKKRRREVAREEAREEVRKGPARPTRIEKVWG